MSRSNYSEDCDGQELALWRGAVEAAIRGARGQKFLCELIAALDAMPEKVLIAEALESDGQFCALGVVGKQKGLDLAKLNPEDPAQIAAAFNIAPALVREIEFENDEGFWCDDTPEKRWQWMRRWAVDNLREQKL